MFSHFPHSHLFLFNQILTIISCSSIIHHKTQTSKHSKNVDGVLFMINSVSFNHWIWTYIHPENNNVDEFVLIHGIVFFVTWNVKHTNLLMFIINLLNLIQQTKLSQYILIPVQVKQELISIRKQLNQRTQRYSSSIKHESRIYLQIVQLLFSTKSFHNSLKSLTRIISLWNLYMDLWDDEPVHPAVFMKCAYRNSLCPVKPQFWSVLFFKTTPNNSQ